MAGAAPDTTIIGTDANEKPAMIRHAAGKGTAYYLGALPGQSYMRKALMPARPMGKGGPERNFSQWEPVDYDPDAAATILLPLTEASITPEAATDHRGVVTYLAEGETATIITVVNLAKGVDGKAKDVQINLSGLRPAKSVHTAMKQTVTIEEGKAGLKLGELDEADVIVVRH